MNMTKALDKIVYNSHSHILCMHGSIKPCMHKMSSNSNETRNPKEYESPRGAAGFSSHWLQVSSNFHQCLVHKIVGSPASSLILVAVSDQFYFMVIGYIFEHRIWIIRLPFLFSLSLLSLPCSPCQLSSKVCFI